MKASRLVNVLLLLQNRGTMTARELATALEVSIRTVHRDVEALAEAGIPIVADRGSAGGFRLMEGYRTRLTGLTGDEAGSLFLAGLPGPAGELGLGEVVAAAQLKLLAALPPSLRERAEELRQRFLLDPGRWFQEPAELPWLATLADAVWSRRPVKITYRRWGKADNVVTRTLNPLGLVLKAGTWYLISAPDGQPRMYRVSSIRDLEVRDGTFETPGGFDLAEAWRTCVSEFESGLYVDSMTVRLAPEGRARMRIFLTPFQANAIEQGLGPPDDKGWQPVDVPVESMEHALHDVLKMAPHMEVIAPHSLRDQVLAVAGMVVAMHGT